MKKTSDPLEIREIYIERLKEDLIGPKSGINEVITEDPINRYRSGILWPKEITAQQDELDHDATPANEGSKEISESADHKNLEIFKQFKPSCAGISFRVKKTSGKPSISISIDFAVYKNIYKGNENYREDLVIDNEDEKEEKCQWLRKPYTLTKDIYIDQEHPVEIDLHTKEDPFKLKLSVLAKKISTNGEDEFAVTVKALNLSSLGTAIEEENKKEFFEERALASIYQIQIKIRGKDGTVFTKRPIRIVADDEDTKVSELIYRNCPEFATGHVCSVSWDQKADPPQELKSEWMPRYVVPKTSPLGAKEIQEEIERKTGSKTISAKSLCEEDHEGVIDRLNALVDGYEDWIKNEEIKLKDLDKSLEEQALKNLENCMIAVKRMREGIEVLNQDVECFRAFELANKSMQIQFEWAEKDKTLEWRPFQLAFALLSLASVSNRGHPDREIFDLLWFPTGGGKTESYLLIIAYTIFLRRIKGEEEADFPHVDVFMRYTLRALTDQQFTRACSMIFACDLVRKNNELGKTPFSIGLWVGSASSPNTWSDTTDAVSQSNSPNDPRKLSNCPCCKKPINYKLDHDDQSYLAICENDKCDIFGELPLATIDSQIYKYPPSLLIGTVDKFAQILRKARPDSKSGFDQATALFNEEFPPELIVQDELHLIDGPLGSMVGILEVGIDLLCEKNEQKVKYLGSTATIRQATKQVKRVFDRNSFQFPPPAIDYSDSGFSKEEDSKQGRLYVGITSEGTTEKMLRENMTASLFQTIKDERIVDKNYFSSIVSYFGSLRILGGALDGIQDSAKSFMTSFANQRNEEVRQTNAPQEITSRVSSTELTEILEKILPVSYGHPKHADVILATNMISVGVDIPRLNLMAVNGQPKSMTEYIQATSRVGRVDPGLVFTLYNAARIRDKSYFESFQTWHSSMYRSVEATTVTPFAPRAMERALHQPLMIIYLHRITRGEDRVATLKENSDRLNKLEEVIEKILLRVERCSDSRTRDLAEERFEDFIDKWIEMSKLINTTHGNRIGSPQINTIWSDDYPSQSLLISMEKAATRKARGQKAYDSFPTPNSARNVDVSSAFKLIDPKKARPRTRFRSRS